MEVGNLEAIGGVAGAILAGGLWLRKLKPQFAADDKIAAIANADMGIIERMEKEGKVGVPDHVGRREVLIDTDGRPV